MAVGQRGAGPVATTGVGVEVDADHAVILDAFVDLGHTGLGVHSRRLRQHGRANEVIRKQLAHAVAKFVANRGPGAGHIEVANVMRHEAGARAEHGQVAAALFHLRQLVGLDGLAQFVIADLEVSHFGHQGRVLDAGNLFVAPVLERLGRGGVVTVDVNDQGFGQTHGGPL